MIIQLKKQLKINGDLWYYVLKDDVCIQATQDESVAEKVYNELINNYQRFEEVVVKMHVINI